MLTKTLMADRVLCVSPIVKHSDRNLVQGFSEFKVDEENLSLEFAVHSTSRISVNRALNIYRSDTDFSIT